MSILDISYNHLATELVYLSQAVLTQFVPVRVRLEETLARAKRKSGPLSSLLSAYSRYVWLPCTAHKEWLFPTPLSQRSQSTKHFASRVLTSSRWKRFVLKESALAWPDWDYFYNADYSVIQDAMMRRSPTCNKQLILQGEFAVLICSVAAYDPDPLLTQKFSDESAHDSLRV